MTNDEDELDDAALEALAEVYAEPAPPALRVRLLATVASDRERQSTTRRLRRTQIVGAIAAAVALAFAGLFGQAAQRGARRSDQLAALAQRKGQLEAQNAQLEAQNGRLEARLDEQGRTLVGLRETLDAQGQVLRLVGGPRILTATLAPQKGMAGAGRVLVDATSGDAAILLSGLTPAGEGKTFELWAIRGKKVPEPAGLITLASAQSGAVRMPSVARPGEVTAFAISIEPSGGSTSPTGPIVLVGAVAS